MTDSKPIRLTSISEFHQIRDLPAPEHPLISVVNVAQLSYSKQTMNMQLVSKGLPGVQFIAGALNVSPGYLSGLLKVLTGQSTQQHVHNKLIAKAKEKLSTTHLSVSEIAYGLGFEHPQSFSKLFKTKTSLCRLSSGSRLIKQFT